MVDLVGAGLTHQESTCASLHDYLVGADATAALPLHLFDTLCIDPWRHDELRGVVLATLVLTLAAELVSYRSVRSILTQTGPTLYLKAVGLCVFNNVLLGPLTLALVMQLGLIRPPKSSAHDQHLPEQWFAWIAADANEVLFVVVLHSLGSMAPHRFPDLLSPRGVSTSLSYQDAQSVSWTLRRFVAPPRSTHRVLVRPSADAHDSLGLVGTQVPSPLRTRCVARCGGLPQHVPAWRASAA
jgi:hypothetical protein